VIYDEEGWVEYKATKIFPTQLRCQKYAETLAFTSPFEWDCIPRKTYILTNDPNGGGNGNQ